MELLSEADPKRASIALALALDEATLDQFFDVVVGTAAPEINQLRLKDAFLEGHRRQGSQAGCAEVDRNQLLDECCEISPQLQAVTTWLLSDL